MKFKLEHVRAGTGTNLMILVEAEGDETIASVTTKFDGVRLEACDVEPGNRSYQCGYRQEGDGGPGTKHKLVVAATNSKGKQENATSGWVDDV